MYFDDPRVNAGRLVCNKVIVNIVFKLTKVIKNNISLKFRTQYI